MLLACDQPVACPSPLKPDARRTARVTELAKTHPEAAALVGRSKPAAVCWGKPPIPVVDHAQRLHMHTGWTDAEAAARMAHLLFHIDDGLPLSRGCDHLADAEHKERAAHALEDRVRATLGAPPLPPSAIDEVIAGYRRRCLSER